jgi:hypothetical protein
MTSTPPEVPEDDEARARRELSERRQAAARDRPPASSNWRSKKQWIAAGVLGALAIGVGVAVDATKQNPSERGTSPLQDAADLTSTPAAQDATFTLSGGITLSDSGIRGTATDCYGTGGYNDLSVGLGVTVYDAGGKIVATGSLESSEGRGTELSGGGPPLLLSCRFEVRVYKVPKGSDFYQVEVGRRGKITVSAKQATSGAFRATLG